MRARRPAAAGALAAAAVALAAALASAQGVGGTALPADLGPPVRVGLDVGSGAAAYASVAAIPDPDLPPAAAAPRLAVVPAPTPAAAAAAADAWVAAGGGGPAAPPPAGAADGGNAAWLAPLGPGPLSVLASGLSAAAAAALAASVPGAVAAELGPGGESVLLPPMAAGAAATAAPRALALGEGLLAGPYPDAATARQAAAALGTAGLWAAPALEPGPGGDGSWYAYLFAPTPAGGGVAPPPAPLAAAARAALAAARLPAAGVTPDPGGQIVAVAEGEVLVAPAVWLAAPGGALALRAGTGAPAAYAGALLFARPSPAGGLWAVDDLPLERYVAGVVAREMPASWPEAALEAQAIACRSYALYALTAGGRAGGLYELVAGPQDQVYGGLGAQTPSTDQATWATAGEVLTYRGAPVQALYEPDSGGYTAPSADVWGTPVPYLAAVPEPPGYQPLRWREVRTGRELEALVRAATGVDVGPVQGVLPLPPLGPGGRVLALALTGPRGTVTVRDDQVRTALDLPSDLFALRTDVEVAVEGAGGRRRVALALEGLTAQGAGAARVLAPGERAVVVGAGGARTLSAAPAAFAFVGRGLGPGLGMSQDGALYLARQGASAAAILLYYYRGVELSWWYGGP